MEKLFDIVHEDADLLVINKPAGLVCHPTKGDVYSSLISRIRLHLGEKAKPHLIHRLDRETGGIVLVAKDAITAGELGKIWEMRAVEKEYVAIVHGFLSADSGVVDAPLGDDEKSPVAIKNCVRADGAPAQTSYRVERRFTRSGGLIARVSGTIGDSDGCQIQQCNDAKAGRGEEYSMLRVAPLTGRKHQIRIHLQHIGHPIVGDKLYGLDENLYLRFVEDRLTPADCQTLILPNHALHALEIRFRFRDKERIFSAQPEPWFKSFAELV